MKILDGIKILAQKDKRHERFASVIMLRAKGLTYREIAPMIGLAPHGERTRQIFCQGCRSLLKLIDPSIPSSVGCDGYWIISPGLDRLMKQISGGDLGDLL